MTFPFDPARPRQLAADLAAPRQQIEAAFVAVGARLTEGAGLLNTLSKLFEALPTALQGADVAEAVGHLEAVAGRAAALSETFEREKTDLKRLVEVVAAASAPIADLRRAVKMMGIVSINARVTAAGIVGDGEDFDVFTTDIATLSESASKTIQDFAQVYRQLTAEVDRAATQRARFESAHADTLSGLAESLGATIAALAQQRTAAVTSSAETGRVSRQVVGRIGSAVMALQVGDATRQRLEHVEAALDCLSDIANGAPGLGQAIAADDIPAAFAAVTTLEQAQLTDTAAAFAIEVAQAEEALGALASDAGTIMAHSRDFQGSENTSAIASLSAQLRAAVTILRDFEAERGKLETVAAAVQETVGVLLGHVGAVQDIEANMRLVSLNAAVRCAQLGPRGAALTVIAMQLRELTSETVVAAEAAMTQLDQSADLARSLGAVTGREGAGQIGELEAQANLALDILAKLDDCIGLALTRLNVDGPRVIRLLEDAAEGLNGQAALAETMDDVALATAALSDHALPGILPPAVLVLADALRKLYTMEAERMIHDQLFASSGSAATAEPEPEMDLDAFML